MKKIGIDEAGRGPLAGPVFVATVYVDNDFDFKKEPFCKILDGQKFKDSKKLSPKAREEIFEAIKKEKHIKFAFFHSSASTIDKHGISKAVFFAMSRALKKLVVKKEDALLLLDAGLRAPQGFNFEIHKKGDEKFLEIALASIVAKVMRDRYMIKLHKKFPQYKFEKHKGYGTKEHIEIIKKLGALDKVHRKSFLRFNI